MNTKRLSTRKAPSRFGKQLTAAQKVSTATRDLSEKTKARHDPELFAKVDYVQSDSLEKHPSRLHKSERSWRCGTRSFSHDSHSVNEGWVAKWWLHLTSFGSICHFVGTKLELSTPGSIQNTLGGWLSELVVTR